MMGKVIKKQTEPLLCIKSTSIGTPCTDLAEYVHDCSHCKVVKGQYTGSNTQSASLIAHNPLDLPCTNVTKLDPSSPGPD